MTTYKAPLRDIQFVTDELLNADTHYQNLSGSEEITAELRAAILSEAAKFSEQEIAPLRQSADEEGCQWSEENVTTPTGFKEAYQQYIVNGWPGISMPEGFGGQGLPISIEMMVGEMLGQANQAWSMYPGLSGGCRATLIAHGTPEMQNTYLPKLVLGDWTGTMCLTEAGAGSDLNLVQTKAKPNDNGSYAITGTKIFISSGDHDMAENIVHIVLARLPDAPKGTRGISLFIVPKFLPDAEGECGERNKVYCGSIEHKMGIHGNSTCVMNFDDAQGFLIGEPHKGLQCMFTFMNSARVGTAMQGLTHSEVALQGALSYAVEREAGRALTGIKYHDRPADLLVVHPDIRKMLLTIRSFSEGHRAFSHYLGQLIDKESQMEGQARIDASKLLSFLTPIAKGFMTETGLEAANIGVQVYGGHGYIREWGMEQNLRDARISTLYEGTTGIQALDLLGRKILLDKGTAFRRFSKELSQYCKGKSTYVTGKKRGKMKPMISDLTWLNRQWNFVALRLVFNAMRNKDEVGSASVDFLMYSGYIVMAYFWAMMAEKAYEQLANGAEEDKDFYRAKIQTAEFYFARILPRTKTHYATMMAGSKTLMQIEEEHFAFV